MAKVGIVTDNSCGLTAEEAQRLGVKLIYIPFLIDGEEYSEALADEAVQRIEELETLLNGVTFTLTLEAHYDETAGA